MVYIKKLKVTGLQMCQIDTKDEYGLNTSLYINLFFPLIIIFQSTAEISNPSTNRNPPTKPFSSKRNLPFSSHVSRHRLLPEKNYRKRTSKELSPRWTFRRKRLSPARTPVHSVFRVRWYFTQAQPANRNLRRQFRASGSLHRLQ